MAENNLTPNNTEPMYLGWWDLDEQGEPTIYRETLCQPLPAWQQRAKQ
jgi:hypothetical protein